MPEKDTTNSGELPGRYQSGGNAVSSERASTKESAALRAAMFAVVSD